MAIVFKAPKSTLNTTSKQIQNVNGDCPPCPEPVLESTELEYTQNGEYTVTPEQGVDGFSSIDVTVNVPSDVNNQDKTVSPSTSSQSVSADSGYSGLGTVTVNAVTSSIDANIQPENILSGVTILGVSGTDEGYDAGYTDGETAGHSAGYAEGEADGIVEGIAEQKAKLTSLNVSANGNYTREDGYDEVNVNVQPNLTTGNITSNGIYAPVGYDGFSSVDVNVQPIVEPKSVSYSANNTYEVTPNPGVDGLSKVTITVNVPSDVHNQNKTVNPSTSFQAITADSGYSGLGTVTVNAVTSSIDQNIAAGNIKSGVSILGVTGNYDPQPDLQAKTVNPSTSQQTVTPDQGKDGLSSVTVTAVTAAIDSNIQAENILSGVTILGVEGTDEGYDAGYADGYAQGQSECPEPGGCEHTAYVQETITTNGTYTYDPSDYQGDSYDAFDGVEIVVNVSGGTPVAPEPIKITAIDNLTVEYRWRNWGELKPIQYSKDNGETWTNLSNGSFNLNAGQEALLRGKNSNYQNYTLFTSARSGGSGRSNISGDMISLLDYENPENAIMSNNCFNQFFSNALFVDASGLTLTDFTTSGCYSQLFSGNGQLVAGPQLPAKIASSNCYNNMFYGCTSLTVAPTLPSKMLGEFCYNGMFSGCTSLTTAPALPATLLADGCYYEMFLNCINLTTAPQLPATTMTSSCYIGMFYNCRKLTTAPILPATDLSGGYSCYSQMFAGCTGLTTAPELPAARLESGCYGAMFLGCTSLTASPVLPAAIMVSECYNGMFTNCTNLAQVTCLATSTGALTFEDCVYEWLDGAAATGTFYKDANMSSWPTDTTTGIPTGWTVSDYVDPSA